MEVVGLQGLSKEIKLKASSQDKNDQNWSHCKCYKVPEPPPLLEQPVLLLPAPTRKGLWPTSHPTPTGALNAPKHPANVS